jgi:hypothetical protein
MQETARIEVSEPKPKTGIMDEWARTINAGFRQQHLMISPIILGGRNK